MPVSSRTVAALRRDRRLPYLVLFAISLMLVAAHLTSYTEIGPIDELQHIDYADKVGHFSVPRFPEEVNQRALGETACRGLDSLFLISDPCGQDKYDPTHFQEGGQNTAAFHPPLYYALVGIPGRIVAAVSGKSAVGVERFFGAFWLGAALCLMLAATTRLGASPWRTVAVLVAVASTAQVVYMHSTVSNDATALFSGALCLWAVVRYRPDRWSAVGLVAAGAFAGATKLTNGFGVGVACLFAVFAPWALAAGTTAAVEWRTRLRPVVLLGVGYAAVTAAWQAVFTVTRLQDPQDVAIFSRFKPAHLTLQEVIAQIPVYADPLRTTVPPHAGVSGPAHTAHIFEGPVPATVTLLVSFLLAAAAYGSWSLLSPSRRSAATVLGASATVLLLVAGPVQYLAQYFASSAGQTQSRYAYSIVPAMAVTGAMLLRAPARWIITALAAVGAASIVVVALWSNLV